MGGSISRSRLTVYDDAATLADEVAAWLHGLALASRDTFSLCLSGGSTPKALYERLAQAPFRDDFPWAKTHVFFGDERFVPAGDKDNNFTMASVALLDHVPLPKANIHRIVTETDTPARAADDYEAVLKRFYGQDVLDPARPLFDVNLLGLGPDGHTASLIPGQPVLDERTRWVSAVSEGRPEVRLTLTYPPLESSRVVAFLVTGAAKKDMLAHVRAGGDDVPAGRLCGTGETIVFADRAAGP